MHRVFMSVVDMKLLVLHMRRSAMLLLLCVQSLSALETSMSFPFACAPDALKWRMSDTNLYNIAYEWTRHQNIDNWSVHDAVANNDSSKRCIEISYDTAVQVPKFFLPYIVSQDKTHIAKKVCVHDTIMQEDIHVKNVPFIESMYITVRGRFLDNESHFAAQTDIPVPWYLEIWRDRIETHVRKSLQEYMQILHKYTCPGPKLLRKRRKTK